MIWKLVPVDPSQPHWETSMYRGVVVIRADSERQARDIAAMALEKTVAVVPGHGTVYMPWRHADLVACHETKDLQYPLEGDDKILVPEVPAYEHRQNAA